MQPSSSKRRRSRSLSFLASSPPFPSSPLAPAPPPLTASELKSLGLPPSSGGREGEGRGVDEEEEDVRWERVMEKVGKWARRGTAEGWGWALEGDGPEDDDDDDDDDDELGSRWAPFQSSSSLPSRRPRRHAYEREGSAVPSSTSSPLSSTCSSGFELSSYDGGSDGTVTPASTPATSNPTSPDTGKRPIALPSSSSSSSSTPSSILQKPSPAPSVPPPTGGRPKKKRASVHFVEPLAPHEPDATDDIIRRLLVSHDRFGWCAAVERALEWPLAIVPSSASTAPAPAPAPGGPATRVVARADAGGLKKSVSAPSSLTDFLPLAAATVLTTLKPGTFVSPSTRVTYVPANPAAFASSSPSPSTFPPSLQARGPGKVGAKRARMAPTFVSSPLGSSPDESEEDNLASSTPSRPAHGGDSTAAEEADDEDDDFASLSARDKGHHEGKSGGGRTISLVGLSEALETPRELTRCRSDPLLCSLGVSFRRSPRPHDVSSPHTQQRPSDGNGGGDGWDEVPTTESPVGEEEEEGDHDRLEFSIEPPEFSADDGTTRTVSLERDGGGGVLDRAWSSIEGLVGGVVAWVR